MRSRRVLVAAVLGVALLASACTGGGSPPPDGGTISGPLLPASPDALPEFDLARFRQLLAELKGTPVVVNIWASWCGPCISEAPHLASLARETKGKVQFLGVDIIDKRPAARAFIHRYGWIYPSLFDPNGSIRDGLGYLGQPHTLVFDRSGQQVFVYSGPVTDDILRAELHTLGVV
jgi:cytochrome c biogenesis protein CcmG, thiol:disulfide interchange protein DsbE